MKLKFKIYTIKMVMKLIEPDKFSLANSAGHSDDDDWPKLVSKPFLLEGIHT